MSVRRGREYPRRGPLMTWASPIILGLYTLLGVDPGPDMEWAGVVKYVRPHSFLCENLLLKKIIFSLVKCILNDNFYLYIEFDEKRLN